MGVFEEYEVANFPFRYEGTLHAFDIAGGTPADKNVLEWHLRNKAAENVTEEEITTLAQAIVEERGVSESEAIGEAVSQFVGERGMTQFRRDPDGGLWIPGNNLKACIKEAGSVAANSKRLKASGWGYGSGAKGWRSWCAEHIFVTDDKLWLGRAKGDDVRTSFPEVKTPRGPSRAIKYTEVCEHVDIDFTIECDVELSQKEWGAIWTTAERIGIGADRSHYGRFEVTRWDRVSVKSREKAVAA